MPASRRSWADWAETYQASGGVAERSPSALQLRLDLAAAVEGKALRGVIGMGGIGVVLGTPAAGPGGKQMAHLVALGVEIALTFSMGGCNDRHLVDHGQVIAIIDKGVGLLGIVRQQANLGESQVFEDLQANAVVAQVGLIAQRDVGLHGIKPLVLQVVGANLFDKADAPALLRKVDQGPRALGPDHTQGHVKLVAAVAPQGIEEVSRETRGVQPD